MGIGFIAFYFVYLGVVLWQLKNSQGESNLEEEVVDEGKMKDIVKDFVRRKSDMRVSDIGFNEHTDVHAKVGAFLEDKLTEEDHDHL